MIFAAALAVAAAGCASTPRIKPAPWTVSITKQTPASIEMDIIGVPVTDQKYYEDDSRVSYDEYWKPESNIRKDALKISKFLPTDKPWIVTFKKDSKHPEYEDQSSTWSDWHSRGVVELLLVARLPGEGGLWKKPISLDKNAWKAKNRTIEVEVKDSKIEVITPPKD